MKKVNLASININFLNVLNILLKEKSPTTAAKRLGLSQAAVSYSLKKLREIFEDDLLVTLPDSRGMQLTQFAKALSEHVEEAVKKVEDVFSFQIFNPLISERRFRLAVTDYALYLFLPKIYMKLRELAPRISLETFFFDFENVGSKIELHEIDIAIGSFTYEKPNKNLIYKLLFEDKKVCIVNPNHPVLLMGNKVSLENYNKFPHLIMKLPKDSSEVAIEADKRESKRESLYPDIVMHNSYGALEMIKTTDLIAISGGKPFNKTLEQFGVKTIDMDFLDLYAKISLCYNSAAQKDQGIQFLVLLIEEIGRNC